MDIMLEFDGQRLTGDARQVGADLEAEDGLRTAIVLSLFTDRRADSSDELPAGETDRRGWWGDLLAAADGDRIGSKIWLLLREKQTAEVALRAAEYAREALQWLVDDGVAASVQVATEWVSRGLLGWSITVARPSGELVDVRFNQLWEAV